MPALSVRQIQAPTQAQTNDQAGVSAPSEAPGQAAGNAAGNAAASPSPGDADAGGPGITARFEAQRALVSRVDAAVARSAADPQGALTDLLQIMGDPGFGQLPREQRARVLYDIGASHNAASRPDEARRYFEAATAGGGLDRERTDRATEAIRRTRGGAWTGAPGSATPADPEQARALEERVVQAVEAGAAGRNEEALRTLSEVYLSTDFPGLPRGLRGRVLFAIAAAHQNTGELVRAISGWNEALGSGLLDASHTLRARDNLRLARAGQPTAHRSEDVLNAMVDGATAMAATSPSEGFDMLFRVYQDAGFRSLSSEQQARTYHNLAALAQRAKDLRRARNFWTEALNAGVLSPRQEAQARDLLDTVLLGESAEASTAPAAATPAPRGRGLHRRPGS